MSKLKALALCMTLLLSITWIEVLPDVAYNPDSVNWKSHSRFSVEVLYEDEYVFHLDYDWVKKTLCGRPYTEDSNAHRLEKAIREDQHQRGLDSR